MNFVDISTSSLLAAKSQQSLMSKIAYSVTRIRYQLGGGLLLAVVLPAILRGNLETFPDQIANYDNSLIGTFAALLLGFIFFRKVTALPGSSAFANILPAFLTSYLLVFAVFFILRLSYSRYQFGLSFVLLTVWFYALMFVISRYRTPKFGVITRASVAKFRRIPGVQWVHYPTPESASVEKSVPLVVDLDDPGLSEEWERYIADQAIRGRRVFSDKQLEESLEGRVQINHLSENSFGHLAPDSIYSPAKHYIDVFFALLALIFLFPLLVLVALAIRLDSKGPAIFRQVRMGFGGKPFTLYKFRSMRVQDDTAGSQASDMTRSDDDRITRIGRFIRKTRIDELPQIVNILLGDMSWIGPRPETVKLSEWYEKEIPFYRYRHIVRPGITGWAQVKQGHVTSVADVKEKLEYDFYYVKHFSLWTDILIVIQTIKVVLTGFGAK